MTLRDFLCTASVLTTVGFLGTTTAPGTTPDQGRLKIPDGPPTKPAGPGLVKLGGRNGVLYIPTNYQPATPMPLLILLHKATGTATNWFSGGHPEASGSFAKYAEAGSFLILAPEAPGDTWGVGPKNWGGDWISINHSIEAAFTRCAVDRKHLAIGGFSDGGSYALSLGLANGDIFGSVIAFSPGYIVRSIGRDHPDIFISHGNNDKVLPIDVTSGMFVDQLRKNGYTINFRRFSGGHMIPPAIADEAMTWLTANFQKH